MKILVTGAGGFVGSRLLSMIQENPLIEAYAIVRQPVRQNLPNVKWIVADLASPGWTRQLPDESVDVVIHLAQSKYYRQFPEKSEDLFAVNVSATYVLAEWSRQHGVKRFIFASSGSVYGARHDGPLHESDVCEPESMYGATKLAAETLLKPFAKFYDVMALRLFSIYGPGQVDAMFPNIFRRLTLGEPIFLAKGIGVSLSPMYLDDCVRAILRFAEDRKSGVFEVVNVGGGEATTLSCALTLMEKIADVSARIQVIPDMPMNLVCSTSKLEGIMGAQDFVTLRDGLQRTFGASVP